MKTGKILLKILVVLDLAIALLIPSTFSWYNHNSELSGREMRYHREDLPVSAGAVLAETKMYQMESDEIQGGSPNKVYYDQKGNKKYKSGTLGSVASRTTQYYGTTFTNTGSAPAYVNLYLNGFKNSTNAYIGTLQPNLTHKGLSSSVHLTNKNFIRVYFQPKTAANWQDNDAKYYVVYKTKTNSTAANRVFSKSEGNNPMSGGTYYSGKIIDQNDTDEILGHIATYYIDLPDDTTEFYFATDGNNSGFNTTTNTTKIPWYRTKTITNIHAETGYYLTGVADDTTWNAQYATFDIPGGISVKTYFDTATINKNQHAYVTLNKGTNFTGVSATYAKTAGTNITVNGNTGYVTTTNFSGSATITTTITGSLGDTTTVTTAVSNPSTIAGVPVALNVEVPGQSTNDDGETVNGTAEIVWYIDNSASSSDVSFTGIYYTK
ncbi:MAG: hypothetical protein UH734_04105 [Ruminococcus sp.]|nr:hypothetical protein [Ruminococcus sp.]